MTHISFLDCDMHVTIATSAMAALWIATSEE